LISKLPLSKAMNLLNIHVSEEALSITITSFGEPMVLGAGFPRGRILYGRSTSDVAATACPNTFIQLCFARLRPGPEDTSDETFINPQVFGGRGTRAPGFWLLCMAACESVRESYSYTSGGTGDEFLPRFAGLPVRRSALVSISISRPNATANDAPLDISVSVGLILNIAICKLIADRRQNFLKQPTLEAQSPSTET
jgi:hypothetical protein